MAHNAPLYIGGIARSARHQFERHDPVTGNLVTTAAAASIAEAREAVDAAAAALPGWSALGPNARRAMLTKAAAALEAKAPELVDAMMGEIGATEGWVRFNLMLAVGMVREAAALTTQISGEVIPSDKPGCVAMALREPAGVVLGIAPWNAPIILGVRAIAVPLACGNSVVLKASEQCPHTHGVIVEAFIEAGFKDGIVNLIHNAPQDAGEVVGAMIDHPAVRRVNFTGSTAVGRIVAQRAAKNLKPALLELGGKAPLLVLDDADLDEAVKAAAFGAFMNQGQICMSTERIIVLDSVADAFTGKFRTKVASMAVGDPRQGKTPLGAVIDRKTVTHVEALVAEAVGQGAVKLNGGEAKGVLMPATVVDKVTPAMKLFREESFGPVVAVIRARDEAHAIELANDTEYGLSASVFTRDIARGLRVARQIKSGICHINGPTVHDEAQMPFGGVKGSGYGRFGGKAGIEAFTELRWITIETQPGHYPDLKESDMASNTVAFDVVDRIAWVRFNRPDKRNCMSPTLNRRMMEVLHELEFRDDVGVLVLTGEGSAWSAGMDLKEYFRESEAGGLGAVRQVQREAYGWWRRLRWYQKPTIAMVNGWCFGGGYGPLYACDLAVAADEAQFALSEINWGILPGGGATKVTTDLVPFRDAMYHALTGETIDGKKASQWRLVNESVPLAQLKDRVTQIARVLLEKNPVALKATKDAVRRVREMTYDNAEDYLVRAQEAANSYDNEGRKEGIRQFIDEKSYKPGLGAYDASRKR